MRLQNRFFFCSEPGCCDCRRLICTGAANASVHIYHLLLVICSYKKTFTTHFACLAAILFELLHARVAQLYVIRSFLIARASTPLLVVKYCNNGERQFRSHPPRTASHVAAPGSRLDVYFGRDWKRWRALHDAFEHVVHTWPLFRANGISLRHVISWIKMRKHWMLNVDTGDGDIGKTLI